MSSFPSLLVAALAIPVLVSGAPPAQAQSSGTHPAASNIALQWGVETNLLDEGRRFRSHLKIQNQGDVWLPGAGWTLYFNFLSKADSASVSGPMRITRINGDFYKLEPRGGFDGLPPGRTATVTFEAAGDAIKYSDAPSGFYVVFSDEQGNPKEPAVVSNVRIEPFARPEQTKRHPHEVVPVPTGSTRYEGNRSLRPRPTDSLTRIVPTPVSVAENEGTVRLTRKTTIHYEEGLATEAQLLAEGLAPVLGAQPPAAQGGTAKNGDVQLRTGSVSVPETPASEQPAAYQLTLDPEQGVEIVGTGAAGVFYGLQSLRAWLPVSADASSAGPVQVSAARIVDAPRFGYRGLHLDVARNFHSVETVKRLLDLMAFYKLNTFHLHLTDDEGWRLAIEGLPELTRVGGRRGHTLTEENHLYPSYWSGPNPSPSASAGSGWYSAEDYVEILQYAKARHIEVIPEIDLPGHARAAIAAMKAHEGDRYRLHDPRDTSTYETIQGWDDGVVNVCQPSTYRFVGKVLDELQAMHERAGAPLKSVHVGGDEVPDGVWTGSPACDTYINRSEGVDGPENLFDHFLGRVHDLLAERGLSMRGWEQVGLTEEDDEPVPNPKLVGRDVQVYAWKNVWGNARPDHAYPLANAGYDVIMSHASNFYFGMTYSKDPAETGMYWAGFTDAKDPFAFVPLELYKTGEHNIMGHPYDPTEMADDYEKLNPEAQSNIKGIQGQLWGEMLWSADRLEYMAVPRLVSLAERAWAPQPAWARIDDIKKHRRRRNAAWESFANQLGQHELPRLNLLDEAWEYRLPPPGAVIEDGTLKANVALPGLPIRYTINGSRPDPNSSRYTGPVPVPTGAVVQLRTFDGQGRGSRTTVVRP